MRISTRDLERRIDALERASSGDLHVYFADGGDQWMSAGDAVDLVYAGVRILRITGGNGCGHIPELLVDLMEDE